MNTGVRLVISAVPQLRFAYLLIKYKWLFAPAFILVGLLAVTIIFTLLISAFMLIFQIGIVVAFLSNNGQSFPTGPGQAIRSPPFTWQAPSGSQTPSKLAAAQIPSEYWESLSRAELLYPVEYYFLASVVNAESGFRTGLISSAGAKGPCQFMEATYIELGGSLSSIDTPECVVFAAKYLTKLGWRNNPKCALFWYNHGPGARCFFWSQSHTYVRKVLDDAPKYRDPDRPTAVAIGPDQTRLGFVWPVYRYQAITTEYGVPSLVEPIHTGIDIASELNAAVYAAHDGVVIESKVVTSRLGVVIEYGEFIEIQGKDGWTTLYGHFHERMVKKGDKVIAGKTLIGFMGSCGYSTGPHLHFTVRKNGVLIPPRAVLPPAPVG